jgi:hypothetical protein
MAWSPESESASCFFYAFILAGRGKAALPASFRAFFAVTVKNSSGFGSSYKAQD